MANWCLNTLNVVGDTDIVSSFVEFAQTQTDEGEIVPISFAKFIPEPDYESIAVMPCITDSPAGDSSSMPDWWNWRISNWGTKWDLDTYTYADINDGHAYYQFDTAWEPPIPVIEKMAQTYPELKFVLTYNEPGMEFSGTVTYELGKVVKEQHNDYSFGV